MHKSMNEKAKACWVVGMFPVMNYFGVRHCSCSFQAHSVHTPRVGSYRHFRELVPTSPTCKEPWTWRETEKEPS